jgi:protein-L-isoaspartate O-methyltransferase
LSDLESAVSTIEAELSRIVNALTALSEGIAVELSDPEKLDEQRVKLAIAKINDLNHAFFKIPVKISTARKLQEEASLPLQNWDLITKNLYQARMWIVQWQSVEHIILGQIPAKRRKLYKSVKKEQDISVSQLFAYDHVFDELQRILNPIEQSDNAVEYGCFGDIAMPNSIFLEHVHAAYRVLLAQGRTEPTRFIDIGCGGGLKTLTASQYFDMSYGLEYDSGYAESARQMIDKSRFSNCRIIEGDGLIFEGYADLDVIYFYRPMQQAEMLKKLEVQITTTVRPGTILIAPYKHFHARAASLGCGRLGDHLYVAKTSQKDANILRRRAEKTGTFVGKTLPLTPGAWDPIIQASLANGFGFDVKFFVEY